MSSEAVSGPIPMIDEGKEDHAFHHLTHTWSDDEELEWVEEEFETLTERDFYNTEWKIGTLIDNKPRDPKSIDTTWVRLTTTEEGTNKATWGDGSQGKWTVDVPSQYFSISKETFGEGTVRGWSPIRLPCLFCATTLLTLFANSSYASPASVVGQWQAIRLGVVDGERVTAEERGVAPWFGKEESPSEETNEMSQGDNDESEAEH
eukprot:scaffold10121_cov64-Cyclotella_meneghiniana.AAC.7